MVSYFALTMPYRNMKQFFSLLTILLSFNLFSAVYAQSKEQCIRFLQEKAVEIKDQIKLINNSRFLVEDASFSMKNNMAEILFQSNDGETITRFCPADIEAVESGNIGKSSPVGTLVIKFESPVSESQYKAKKREDKPVLRKVAYFNFLQKDPKNEEQIKKVFMRLQSLVNEENSKAEIGDALLDYTSFDPFWLSVKPNSYTYEMDDFSYGGGELKLFYSMEEVTLKNTSKADYVVVIPMAEVDEVILDKKNAKPASVWLKTNKDNFRIFRKDPKEEKYVFEKGIDYAPLFVKFTNEIDQLDLEMDIEDTKKASGGGKIKTRLIR